MAEWYSATDHGPCPKDFIAAGGSTMCVGHRPALFSSAVPTRTPNTLTRPAWGMDLFGDILGNGDKRPPAPEVAEPADVEQYNLEFAKAHGVVPTADSGGRTDPEEAPFAKADDDSLGRNTKHKADFPWLWDPSRGVRWDFNPIALRNLAQTNTWVGMLVQTITKEVAETPWTIVEADGRVETQKRLSTHPGARDPIAKADGEPDELPDETARRIHDLLSRPNPDDTWQDMVEMWLGDLLEVGSTATVKAFHRSAYGPENELKADPSLVEPRALQPSAPEVWTKDYHERTGVLDGFWQFDDHRSPGTGSVDSPSARSRGVQQPTFFDTSEMIWSDMTPRTNRRYGIPPTLLVEDFLQSLDLAVTQEQQYLSRGSIPSGAWVFENWDREQLKERKQEMEENVKGKPHKSLMFAGMDGNVKFEPMSMNFQELEFTERMKWYARVVASSFQVPTAVVGIEPERVNYNTFQGERENFENNTLGPYLQKIERFVNKDLIHPHWGQDYRFEFMPGMSETTRDMISSRVRSEFNANIRTRNEARRELGLAAVDPDENGFKDAVVEDSSDGPFGDVEGLENALTKDDDGGGSGNANLRKDEPLRETDDWHQFDVQPHMVEDLTEDIADDVREVFDQVLDDEQVMDIIDRLAADEETEKSLSALHRRLREIFEEAEVVGRIEQALREETADAARTAIDNAIAETDEDPDVDVDAIESQLRDREVEFADSFAEEMSEDIRSTVGDGWAEGKGTREIASEIADQADINEGWNGAEKIARQELHISTGHARSEFASDIGKVEIWNTSGDNRVRPAHQDMDGTWKWPGDNWEVDYSEVGRGVQKESVPGASRPGIGCRCGVLLRDRETVDDSDYAGDGDPR